MAGAQDVISCLEPFGGHWMCQGGMGSGCQGEVVAALVAVVPIVFILYM